MTMVIALNNYCGHYEETNTTYSHIQQGEIHFVALVCTLNKHYDHYRPYTKYILLPQWSIKSMHIAVIAKN